MFLSLRFIWWNWCIDNNVEGFFLFPSFAHYTDDSRLSVADLTACILHWTSTVHVPSLLFLLTDFTVRKVWDAPAWPSKCRLTTVAWCSDRANKFQLRISAKPRGNTGKGPCTEPGRNGLVRSRRGIARKISVRCLLRTQWSVEPKLNPEHRRRRLLRETPTFQAQVSASSTDWCWTETFTELLNI